ncbi:BRCA1-A complex subunit Abraxas 1 isoform X2 [Neolamprologus brichardi]|uniref:BRCA1-A complex subunit Abraxas 1 isoform X2 n=1 Tax=Neolamprologus brichardi TaxID=32507 RepID=UPI001643AE05|nr:BRCA1-A complex subunit Abraxas 1 isoform X2 [Neolamprologus brichardi]
MAEPTVRLPGIVLASLMFQHVNSDSDVEGLILGESRFDEQVTISDSQADHIHIEETYNVQKHIACHRLNTLYSSDGQVNAEELHKLLAENKQSVIGWYRQRRNSEQQMTFREKLVHENLKSALSNPHMIFVLLTPTKTTPPGSTHRMEYSAFISRSRHFMNVPVLITNLGLLEQLSYWKVSAPCSAAGYSLTMKKHGSKFFCSSGLLKEVNEVNKMNDSLQAELQKTCRDVEESERLVEMLQTEVSALRTKLRERQQSESGKESAADPCEPRKNRLLQEAVRALLASSPLFHTQTLTLQGLPVPDHTDDISITTAREAPPSATNYRKRLREMLPEKERKRRRSKS